ncbi:MAG: CinA family nicotinamide mononucleotide deamidase-related protein [Bacteroidota bacterium]
MTATLLTVGDELLIGQVTNTNAAWLGDQLSLAGYEVRRHVTVGDVAADIHAALEAGFATGSLVVVTGGLGPTHDDVTKKAVADYFGKGLHADDALEAQIAERYVERGRPVPPSTRRMALVPVDFEKLDNPIGTAAGLWYADERDERARIVAVMPGVPYEMEAITKTSLLPKLREAHDGLVILHRTLLTVGYGETMLAQQLGADAGDLAPYLGSQDEGGAPLGLAYLPGSGGVRLRLTAKGDDREEAQVRLDRFAAFVQDRLGDAIYGEGDDTLEAVVGQMLRERGLTVAVAESCTGGRVMEQLVRVSGASAYLKGGVVAYCNEVKRDVLGVSAGDLDEHGAVSEPVVRQMAEGVRARLGTDVAISTSGIAGPGGGTPAKPVGTLWLAYADATDTYAVRLALTKNRGLNLRLASMAALNLLRRQLLRREPQPGPSS